MADERVAKIHSSAVAAPQEDRQAVVKLHASSVAAPPESRIAVAKIHACVVVESRAGYTIQQIHG
jgi:hypothetical protein